MSGEIWQTGGPLTGDVDLTGRLHWQGGEQDGPGTTTVESGGVIDVESCFSATLDDGRTLLNRGTVRLAQHSVLSLGFGDALPAIENPGRIEIDDTAAGSCGGSTGIFGSGLVHNTGTIEKLGGTGTGALGGTLDNDGVVRVSAGKLELTSDDSVTQSGTFTSVPGASYDFSDGTFVLVTGAVLSGSPDVTGAELRIPPGMSVSVPAGGAMRLSDGGTISGAGTLRVLGTLAWLDGGQMSGAGTTVIEPGGAATLSSPDPADPAFGSLEDSRSLVNAGTLTVTDANLEVFDGASILNRGTMVLTGETQLDGSSFGSGFSGLLHNTGTLRKTGAGAVEVEVALDNDGTIQVDAGALNASQLMNFTSDFFFGGPRGAIVGGSYLVKGTLGVPGDVEIVAGRLVLDGAGSKVQQSLFGGTPEDALAGLRRVAGNGELRLTGGRSLATDADDGAFSNAGVLRLDRGSVFTAAAGYAQAPGGVLRAEIPATGAAGRLAVTGTAALAGRLDALSPAHPPVGTDVTVVSYGARTGTFGDVTGASGYDLRYDADGVKLRVLASLASRLQPTDDVAPAATDEDAGTPAPAPTLRLDDGALRVSGPWARRGEYLVATRRGATLTVPGVTGRRLSLVARTCRACGAVRVTWAGRKRLISLRSRRPARRTIRVFSGARRTGKVRVRATSARRVAIDAVIVRR